MAAGEVRRGQAEPVQRPGAVAADDDVGAVEQAVQGGRAGRRGEVQRRAALGQQAVRGGTGNQVR